jgi:hypothetical protein
MTTTISSKAMALAGISVLVAGTIAVVDTVAKGYLFEIKKATAELEKAQAEMAQAKATVSASEQVANGTLGAAQAQANATVAAASRTASAMVESAARAAKGQVESARLSSYTDNNTYDHLTGPMIADPVSKISQLNDQIVRLDIEMKNGMDLKTQKPLSTDDLTERANLKKMLEGEVDMAKKSASKTLSDSLSLAMDGMKGLMPGLMDSARSASRSASVIQ